jgi:hypothetical protein
MAIPLGWVLLRASAAARVRFSSPAPGFLRRQRGDKAEQAVIQFSSAASSSMPGGST